MAYEPTEWKKGDVVTSAKLNKLEQGVTGAGCVLVVHIDIQTGALDKTWKEIKDAVSVMPVFIYYEESDGTSVQYISDYVTNVMHFIVPEHEMYGVYTGNFTFTTNSENGYPVKDE